MMNEEQNNDFYNSGIEHIYDELVYVDKLLEAEVAFFRYNNPQLVPLGQSRGIFISDEEIDQLVTHKQSAGEWARDTLDIESEYGKLRAEADTLRKIIDKRLANSLEQGVHSKLSDLRSVFGCTPLDTAIIMICMAPEIDRKYRKIYSYLYNDMSKKHPTVDLVLNLTCGSYEEKIAAQQRFSIQSPLFKYHMLEFIENEYDKNRPLLARDLKVNDRVRGYLLGSSLIDDSLARAACFHTVRSSLDDLIIPADVKRSFGNFIDFYLQDNNSEARYLLSFTGSYGPEKKDTAAVLCKKLEIPLLVIDLESVFNSISTAAEFNILLELALRESRMLPAALYFQNSDTLFDRDADEDNSYFKHSFVSQMEKESWLAFVDSEQPVRLHGSFERQVFLEFTFPLPDYTKRIELWGHHIGNMGVTGDFDISELSSKYSLNSDQIKRAVMTGNRLALLRSPHNIEMNNNDLYQSCNIHSSQRLRNLAHKIVPRFSWDKVVLPADNKQMLKDLVESVRYKHKVLDTWGFNRSLSIGKGVTALFWGAPGTGKTMCADVIAHELGMELYKIDLSTIVSKYIGETEKNLDKIFSEAERGNAILFFDEADALFGKRSEVKDSHDRYANIEVGYLLQRMEEYNGVVILSSNLKQNMDEAFTRRLQYVVHFPFPDETSRLDIWEHIFPGEAPVAGDIDFSFLADQLKIAGGSIKNIALGAAFFAAQADSSIAMEHVLRACKREFLKIKRPLEFDDILKKWASVGTDK